MTVLQDAPVIRSIERVLLPQCQRRIEFVLQNVIHLRSVSIIEPNVVAFFDDSAQPITGGRGLRL
jgi:hypothetical protein